MQLNEYQQHALDTAVYSQEYRVIYPALGLTGEAGEVAEKIKKVLRDYNGDFQSINKHDILNEIGDVLWYVAVLTSDLGYSLEDVAVMNIEKLKSRQERDKIHGNGDNR